MYNLQDFSQHAVDVVVSAQKKALRSNSDCVHALHLLHGLLEITESTGYALMMACGVRIADVTYTAGVQGMGGVPMVNQGTITWGKDMIHVIELARDEVNALNQTQVGTEHLLVALLRAFQEHTSDLLARRVGLTPDDIRRCIGQVGV